MLHRGRRRLLMEGNPQYAKLFKELSKGLTKQVRGRTTLQCSDFSCRLRLLWGSCHSGAARCSGVGLE